MTLIHWVCVVEVGSLMILNYDLADNFLLLFAALGPVLDSSPRTSVVVLAAEMLRNAWGP